MSSAVCRNELHEGAIGCAKDIPIPSDPRPATPVLE